MSMIRVNDLVRVSRKSASLVEYRGREGRVIALRAREARLAFEDGQCVWFYDWHLEPAPESNSTDNGEQK